MSIQDRLKQISSTIAAKQAEADLLSKALYDYGSKVVYNEKVYFVTDVNVWTHKQEITYDLTEPKLDGTRPQKAIKARYGIAETALQPA